MDVFVAGATGTLGRPLVRALVGRGHRVVGLTRSAARRGIVEADGAEPAVADALDARALARAVAGARPSHVVHALTALPAGGPTRRRHLAATNALRIEGTQNLLRAAIEAGARRLVAESFFAVNGPVEAESPVDEDAAFAEVPAGAFRDGVLALREMERHLALAASGGAFETVVLRFGGFYGPGVPTTEALVAQLRAGRGVSPPRAGCTPFIHVDDAVTATMAALERGRPGAVYNIVDDEAVTYSEFIDTAASVLGARTPRRLPWWLLRLLAPLAAELVSWRLPLANARAKVELGWSPSYRTPYDGLARLAVGRRERAA